MTNLFVFFVLPLVTILLAIVLQKILRNPILVGITFFAVYLIVAFTAFSGTLAAAIIGAIILSIIAFITAIIVQLICICRGNLLRISCNSQNGENNDLLTINNNCNNINNDNDSNNSNNCGCNNRESIVINADANPINTNIRRCYCNRGYRRF